MTRLVELDVDDLRPRVVPRDVEVLPFASNERVIQFGDQKFFTTNYWRNHPGRIRCRNA